jgi:hypothetical protein
MQTKRKGLFSYHKTENEDYAIHLLARITLIIIINLAQDALPNDLLLHPACQCRHHGSRRLFSIPETGMTAMPTLF